MVPFAKKYWTVFQVGIVLLKIRLVLRLWSLSRVLAWLTPVAATGARDEAALDNLVYYIDRWLQILPYNRKGNCFPRSLALYWFAWRSGVPVQFHCGVRMGYLNLEGHAWLTMDGTPFQEVTQQWRSYTVTYSYPSDSSQRPGTVASGCEPSNQIIAS